VKWLILACAWLAACADDTSAAKPAVPVARNCRRDVVICFMPKRRAAR